MSEAKNTADSEQARREAAERAAENERQIERARQAIEDAAQRQGE
jgi:hypothetical protein